MYVPRAIFPKTEVARVKSYIQRLGISPNSSLMLTPTTGPTLNTAPAISPGPSSLPQVSPSLPQTSKSLPQASPSLPPTVLVQGMTAQTWSQVVGEAARKKAASKAATEKAPAEKQGGSYEEQFPRYVGRSASSSPITFDDTSDYSDGNISSSLLPLPTNISSLGHILPRRDE